MTNPIRRKAETITRGVANEALREVLTSQFETILEKGVAVPTERPPLGTSLPQDTQSTSSERHEKHGALRTPNAKRKPKGKYSTSPTPKKNTGARYGLSTNRPKGT